LEIFSPINTIILLDSCYIWYGHSTVLIQTLLCKKKSFAHRNDPRLSSVSMLHWRVEFFQCQHHGYIKCAGLILCALSLYWNFPVCKISFVSSERNKYINIYNISRGNSNAINLLVYIIIIQFLIVTNITSKLFAKIQTLLMAGKYYVMVIRLFLYFITHKVCVAKRSMQNFLKGQIMNWFFSNIAFTPHDSRVMFALTQNNSWVVLPSLRIASQMQWTICPSNVDL